MANNTHEEPIDSGVLEIVQPSALAAQTSSEIDRQIATAKRYPRSLARFEKQAGQLIALDKESAASCVYAIPRGKEKNAATGEFERKIVKGPTARFAESILQAWGNCRCRAFISGEDEHFVTAQAIFFDLESNVAISHEVRRRITDSENRRFSPDMIGLTCNAAISIALRNAILRGIPQPVWKKLYLLAEKTILGDVRTLSDSRKAVFEQFKPYGLTATMVCGLVGAAGPSEVVGEHLITLQGILTALHDGEVTVETLLAESQDRAVAEKGRSAMADIKAKYQPVAEVEIAGRSKEAAEAAQARLQAKRAKKKEAAEKPMMTAAEIGFEGAQPEEKEPF